MPMRIDPLLAVVLIASTVACATGGGSATVTTHDSAGVTIIEYPAGAVEGAPRWTPGAATLTIAELGSADETFTRVVGVSRLGDGRFVVVDYDNRNARPFLFTADGTFERALGRVGNGPGEFQFARVQAVLPGDTILFWDMQMLRLTVMLPSGEVLGTEGLGTIGMMTAGAPVGRLANGRLLSVPYGMEEGMVRKERTTKFFRDPGPLVLLDPTHQSVDTIATDVLGAENYVATFTFGDNSETGEVDAPYGSRTQLLAAGDRIVVTTNQTPDVASYSLPWQLRRITRFARPRRPIDAAAREAYISYSIAEVERRPVRIPQQREWQIKWLRESQFPDSMGYYTSAMLGADSTIWLAEARSMADSTPTYLLIGSDGHLRARMALPADSRLLWAGADDILVVLRDDDDIERLELRPIIKP